MPINKPMPINVCRSLGTAALAIVVVSLAACSSGKVEHPIESSSPQPEFNTTPAAALQSPPVPTEPPHRLPIPIVGIGSEISPPTLVGCEIPELNEPVGNDGCALLTGVRRGLQFVGSTAQLNPASASSISALASTLQAAPGVRIEIRAHAEASDGQNAAQAVSRERSIAVARALVSSGVSVNRLTARAFGNTEPVVNSGSSVGELLPNRVEFVVQP